MSSRAARGNGTGKDGVTNRRMSDYVVTPENGGRCDSRTWRARSHVTTTLRNAIASGRLAHAYLFSGPRGVGKTTTARILAKAVNCLSPSDSNPDNDVRIVPGDHRRAELRRPGDRRRLQPGRRGDPQPPRIGPLCPDARAVQGLHHRRSAHADEGGVQRPPEDAGGAPAARAVHLRHHRNPQGSGDHPLAVPALRLPADRASTRSSANLRAIAAAGRARHRRRRSPADRAERGRLAARCAEPLRPGRLALRPRHHAHSRSSTP